MILAQTKFVLDEILLLFDYSGRRDRKIVSKPEKSYLAHKERTIFKTYLEMRNKLELEEFVSDQMKPNKKEKLSPEQFETKKLELHQNIQTLLTSGDEDADFES